MIASEIFGNFGGIQRFNRLLIRALNDVYSSQYSIDYLSLLDIPIQKWLLDKKGVDNFKAAGGSKNLFLKHFISELIKKPKIIILSHPFFSPLLLLIRVLSPSSKVIIMLFGFETWKHVTNIQLLGFNLADSFISISRFTREMTCNNNSIPLNKVHVIHLALESSWIDTAINHSTPSAVIEKNEPYFLTVSRLDSLHGHYKGIDCVIKALGKLQGEAKLRAYRYVIVGDGDDKPRLEQITKDCGVQDRVDFVGNISDKDMQCLYKGCRGFLLPSKGEGFGFVYLEAMRYSKPIVASNYGACGEVIENGKSGFLVTYGNVMEISEAIEKLISSESLCKELGTKGFERLNQYFTFTIFTQHLKQYLDEILT